MNTSNPTPTIAVYSGTFDPITNGHLDLINRGLNLFDKIIVAIAVNSSKQPLFNLAERRAMIEACFANGEAVEVDCVNGLIVEYAVERGARAILRGMRAVSDFDYELQLALMNRKLKREVESVFLMPGFRWIYISSSIVKEAARYGGDVEELVPAHVNQALQQKFGEKSQDS